METCHGFPEGAYFITGITGYVGSSILRDLINSEEFQNGKIKVAASVRNLPKWKEMENLVSGKLLPEQKKNFVLIQKDILDLTEEDIRFANLGQINYLIHCAAVTQSKTMITQPVETADSIVLGTRHILEIARSLQIRSMVYLSSMEVYGQIAYDGNPLTEEKLGDIDLTQVRSCYPLGKRMAEYYCHAFFEEYGLPVKTARLAQTFGEGVLPGENRVFAQFARAAADEKDIVMHTEGKSVGNYCDIGDTLRAIAVILKQGADGETYNVVNEANTMTIRQMAELVASRIAKGRIRVVLDIPQTVQFGYAPETGLHLSAEKLRKLGWTPKTDLEEMYRNMMSGFQNPDNAGV